MNEKALRADARRNLELILQAAGEAFAEGGLEVGVADIARRAGVGTATIFRRFPTKEDLVAAVFQSRIDEMLAICREAAAMPGGIEAIRTLLERAAEFQVRDRGFMESVGKRRFAADERFAAARDEMFERLDEIVAKAQAAGEVRDDVSGSDLPVLMHGLVHAAEFVDCGAPGVWQRYLDLLTDALRPGAAHPLCAPPPTAEQLQRPPLAGRS